MEETFIELPKRRACQSTYSVEPTPTPRQPRNRQRRQILKLRDLKDFHFAPPKLRDILKRDAEPKTWSENWSDSEDSEERTAAEVEEKKELIAQVKCLIETGFQFVSDANLTLFLDIFVLDRERLHDVHGLDGSAREGKCGLDRKNVEQVCEPSSKIL